MNSRRWHHRRIISGRTAPWLYALASGKGGVGKSVIAFNLAECLSQTRRVLLIDADFHMGNLHLLANVTPNHGWQAVCRGQIRLDEALVAVNERLHLLASSCGQSEEAFPNTPSLAAFLSGLREAAAAYDLVIFDTVSGILPQTHLILSAVDEVILTTTPELTAISNCYALYKVLVSGNPAFEARLLVNQEDDEETVRYIYDKFCLITSKFLGRSPAFLGGLGADRAVVESVALQSPLSVSAPDSTITRQLAALARRLDGDDRPAGITLETINVTPAGVDIKE